MKRLATVAIAALLLFSVFAGLGVVTAQEDQHAGGDEYNFDRLNDDAKHYSEPGWRIVPGERLYWLEVVPANQPYRDVTKTSEGKSFGSGMLLKTNTVYLRTIRTQTSSESINVTVVTWDKKTKFVEEGNETEPIEYAANVSATTQQINLGTGKVVAPIDIPRHDDEKQVTMWIEGHEDTVKWTFTHQSIAFTQPLDANTYAEFVLLAGLFVILPALITGWYGTKKVRSWVDRAGAPPGHGATYYAGIAMLATVGIVFFIYAKAAEIIVTAPVVLGVGLGVVFVGYMLATHEGQTTAKLFWQPHIESVSAFAKTKIPSIGADSPEEEIEFSEDMPFGQMVAFRILDEGKDGMSIVQDGWMAFLARLKGGRAVIENANELRTRFSLWNSGWDEVFIVDPDADSIIDYERPGLSLKTPEIKSWHDLVQPGFIVAVGGGFAWKLAQIYGTIAWAILAFAVPYLIWKFAVEGTDSYVHINPAPVAMRPVLASMFVLHMGHRDAASLEEAEEFAWRALAGQEEERLSWERDRDETFVDETFRSGNGSREKESKESTPRKAIDDIEDVAADGGEDDE